MQKRPRQPHNVCISLSIGTPWDHISASCIAQTAAGRLHSGSILAGVPHPRLLINFIGPFLRNIILLYGIVQRNVLYTTKQSYFSKKFNNGFTEFVQGTAWKMDNASV